MGATICFRTPYPNSTICPGYIHSSRYNNTNELLMLKTDMQQRPQSKQFSVLGRLSALNSGDTSKGPKLEVLAHVKLTQIGHTDHN